MVKKKAHPFLILELIRALEFWKAGCEVEVEKRTICKNNQNRLDSDVDDHLRIAKVSTRMAMMTMAMITMTMMNMMTT